MPDAIFNKADSLARRLKISRSELFTLAVSDYVNTHQHHQVIERLNAVYSTDSSSLDPVLKFMQTHSLNQSDPW